MFETTLNRREIGIEWPLWMAVLALMTLGAAFIFSATGAADIAGSKPWWRYTTVNQIIACGLGMAAAAALCLQPYHRLARWSFVIYWVSIALLILVFIVGVNRLGATRWINLRITSFQPSEFAKLAFLFALANYLSRPVEELKSPVVFLKALAMAVLPFALILKEPDLGSSLVFLPVTLTMMAVAGIPRRYLWSLVGGGALMVALLLVDVLLAPPNWRFVKLQEYQKRRLMVYFNLDFAPRDASEIERKRALQSQRDARHNVEQALISIGSGGLTGKGWRMGTQYALGFLPSAGAHNDFIYSVIAEEKGFVGSLVLISLYAVVLFTGVYIASQARDRLGKLLAAGITTLFFTHLFINIGMNLGLMPVTGIPLPLVSAGGTSVLCSLAAIGILQNVALYKRHY